MKHGNLFIFDIPQRTTESQKVLDLIHVIVNDNL